MPLSSSYASFKAYLMYKENGAPCEEVRRFVMDLMEFNYLNLRKKVRSIFPRLHDTDFLINWKDSEGDLITISNREDLSIFTQEAVGDLYKIYITLKPKEEEPSTSAKATETVHSGIVCDACDTEIKGFRYKCVQCPDYDLCQECESQGYHPEHCMFRISVPILWSNQHGRRLCHHMRKFIKKSTAHAEKRESSKECSGRGQRHGRYKSHGDDPSWIDTFATYINEWANLPMECPMKETAKKVLETQTTAGKATTEDKSSAEGKSQTQTKSPPESNAKEECIKEAKPHIDLIKIFEDHVAHLLDPLGIDVNIQVKNDKAPVVPAEEPVSDSDSSGAEEQVNINVENKDKKTVDDKDVGAADAVKPSTSNNTAAPAEKSPDGDEWMIVNKVETPGNSSASSIASSVCEAASEKVKPSAPAEPATQKEKIYPALPKQEATIYHSNPKIQRAVEAMMAMGFSNDGGWLTQLLISKDGDISKALDVLQPVHP